MPHPYWEYEGTPLWATLDGALADLEGNRDVSIATARTHIIGYLCRALTRAGVAVRANTHLVPVVLSADEALVLFDMLARSGDAGSPVVEHPAEEQVLWRIEGALERQLVAPFDRDYAEQLAAAQTRITQSATGRSEPPAI